MTELQGPLSFSSGRISPLGGTCVHPAVFAERVTTSDSSSFNGLVIQDACDQPELSGVSLLKASKNQVASGRDRIWALYAMKKCEYIQEDRGDDRTIQILKEVTFCRQLNSVVRSFFNGEFDYPSPMVVGDIVRMIKEGGDL